MEAAFAPRFEAGTTPLLISIPHAGTALPRGFAQRLSQPASELPDTDRHVDRLYEFAREAGAGLLVARVARYVVDLNRPPDDLPLYDASATRLLTGLVPLTTFQGERVYREGDEPAAAEVTERVERYWKPYHRILQRELDRLVECHGHAVLLDAHSIRSRLPLLFEGRLPALNLGTNGGRSAAAELIQTAFATLAGSQFSHVLDGRFRGGYITRHYGRPAQGRHVLQLELAQSAYLDEEHTAWDADRARELQQVLREFVNVLVRWKPGHD